MIKSNKKWIFNKKNILKDQIYENRAGFKML